MDEQPGPAPCASRANCIMCPPGTGTTASTSTTPRRTRQKSPCSGCTSSPRPHHRHTPACALRETSTGRISLPLVFVFGSGFVLDGWKILCFGLAFFFLILLVFDRLGGFFYFFIFFPHLREKKKKKAGAGRKGKERNERYDMI